MQKNAYLKVRVNALGYKPQTLERKYFDFTSVSNWFWHYKLVILPMKEQL